MRGRLLCSAALLAALTGCDVGGSSSAGTSLAAVQPASDDLANPVEVRSRGGVVKLVLAAVLNPATGGPALSYAGALQAPTIRLSPGDTIDVTYANELPNSSSEPLDVASLHFHGLSVSPLPPSDDSIDLMAMPGQTLHYVIKVPASQPPGLYWYHSHSHGEADWQLTNGMSGALVVEGTAGVSPATSGLPERVIVLRNVVSHADYSTLLKVRAGRGNFGNARSARRTALDATALPTAAPSVCQQGFDVPTMHTTINGQNAGVPIAVQPGRKQFWRILNASSNGFYDLHLDGSTFHVVALDGVPLRVYPGAAETDLSELTLPPGGRAEVIVTGTGAAGALHTSCTDTGSGGDPNPPQVLAVLHVGVPGVSAVAAAPATRRAHGTYDLPLGGGSVERSLAFTESSDGEQFYLNGAAYSPAAAPMFTVASGSVERWTLTNATQELHVFHIHQLHFVVQDVDGIPEAPHWSDTVSLPYQHADGTPSVTHVLLDFRDPIIRGTFLFHCHLLEHEDGGMMAKIAVL